MGWFGTLVVFVVVWWLIFFMTLPFGVRVPDETEPGHATSAPEHPRLLLKASITTAITTALTGLVYAAVANDWIAFRDMVQ